MNNLQLDLRVNGVDFTYDNEQDIDMVRVRFTVTDPQGEINASGRVAVTTDEYFSAHGFEALAELARTKLVDRLEGSKEEVETE